MKGSLMLFEPANPLIKDQVVAREESASDDPAGRF